MRSKYVSQLVIVLGTIYLGMVSNLAGQNGGGTVWYSPDKSFSVNVPVPLKLEKTDYSDARHSRYVSIKLFAGRNSKYAVLLYVLRLDKSSINLSSEEKLRGLDFMLGSENDQNFEVSSLKVNGSPSRQIIFANQNKKGLLIDAGDRIVVLGIVAETRNDMESEAANSFLRSFRLTTSKQK